MTLNYSPPSTNKDNEHLTRWMSNSGRLLNALSESGTTANRPVKFLFAGRTYFDTSLAAGAGKPIWYNGASWVDATGTGV